MATRSQQQQQREVSRRGVHKKAAGAAITVSAVGSRPAKAQVAVPGAKGGFVMCINTSTIRGQKVPLPQEIELSAKAGYTAMEPWIGEISDYVKAGGDLKDLKKRFAD